MNFFALLIGLGWALIALPHLDLPLNHQGASAFLAIAPAVPRGESSKETDGGVGSNVGNQATGDKPLPEPGDGEAEKLTQPPVAPSSLPTSCSGLPQGSRCSTSDGRDGTCKSSCTLLVFCNPVQCVTNATQVTAPHSNSSGATCQNVGARCGEAGNGICRARSWIDITAIWNGSKYCEMNYDPTAACQYEGQACAVGAYAGRCQRDGLFGLGSGAACQSTGELTKESAKETPPPAACLSLFDLNHDGKIDQAEYDAIVKRRNQHSLNQSQNNLVDGGACKPGSSPGSAQNPLTRLPSIASAQKDPFLNQSVPSAAECGPVIAPYDTNPRDGALSAAEIAEATKLYTAQRINDDQYFKILACREGGQGGGAPPPSLPSNMASQPLPGGQGPPKHLDVPGLTDIPGRIITPDIFNDVNGDNKFTPEDCELLAKDLANKGIGPADFQYDFTGDKKLDHADVQACKEYFRPQPPTMNSNIPVAIACLPPSAAGLKAGDLISCTANAQPAAGHVIASYLWRATFPPNAGADQTFKFSVPSNQSTGLLTVIVTSDDGATGTSAPMSFIFPAPAGQTTNPPGGNGTPPVPNISLSIQPPTITLTVGNQQCYYGCISDNGKCSYNNWTESGQWQSTFVTKVSDPHGSTYCVTPVAEDVGKIQNITLDVTYQGKPYPAALNGIIVNPATGTQPPAAGSSPTLAITISPKPASVNVGQSLDFSYTIGGTAPGIISHVVWSSNLAGSVADHFDYAFSVPMNASGQGWIYVQVGNEAGDTAEDKVTFNINAPAASAPAISIQGPIIGFIGKTVTLTATLTPDPGPGANIIYYWQSDFNPPTPSGPSNQYTFTIDNAIKPFSDHTITLIVEGHNFYTTKTYRLSIGANVTPQP